MGRRPPGEPDRHVARARARAREPVRRRARPQRRGASRGVRRRRRRRDHRPEDGAGAAAARLGRAAGGRAGRARTSPGASRARSRSRSSTTTRGRWRRSDAAPPSSRCRRADDEGPEGPLAWGAVHLALLSTGEDRAKAIVDWTWAGFTHERPGRITASRKRTRAEERRGRGMHEPAVLRHGHGRRTEMTSAATATAPASTAAKAADVFVVFGITGDLAKVMTFRSLYRLEQRGLLECPIVGVAFDDWTVDQLVQRARDSIVGTGEQLDEEVFDALRRAALLRPGRLRRRCHVRARRRGDRGRREHPSSTSRSRRSSSAAWSRASPRPG